MPLPVPNLDDRDFAQLLAEARAQIPAHCPEWTDLSPSDPGIVLLELFAYLTDTMLYRLNRLPEKAYVAFLNLLGVRLHPPAAASTVLHFTLSRPATTPVTIPRGTRVTIGRAGGNSEAPVFVTEADAVIAVGATEADALAYHCEVIEGEQIGPATGLPGQVVRVTRPPIIMSTGDLLDLVVGVEAMPAELGERAPARQHLGQTYRLWREVPNFAQLGDDRFAYVVDRTEGIITFAPASGGTPLAEVPRAGREIRVWYRRGGGAHGNVAAGTLTVLKDPIAGVEVTNPAPATGGRAGETVDNALVRGPQEIRSLERAVTAKDFETVATSSTGAVSRAKAFTRSALWAHARPGEVEVLLVPTLAPGEAITADAATLESRLTPDALSRVQDVLDERRPLGTKCRSKPTRYKSVRVAAKVVVHRAEDRAAVAQRLDERLRTAISPVPVDGNPNGWPFGQALRASNVFDVLLAERGVRYVDAVRLVVDDVPREVSAIVADPNQAHTWYCGSGATLFRSSNDGDGWEPAGRFDDETVEVIRTHAGTPGLLVVATKRMGDGEQSRLRLSRDCGETWEEAAGLEFHVEDMAIMDRDGTLVLLLATDRGLYEQALQLGATPVQVLVNASNQSMGFYAVAVSTDVRGAVSVAVAGQELAGVYLSQQAARPGTFISIGLDGIDVRLLTVQEVGPRRFLYAGATAAGEEPGRGVQRLEIRGTEVDPQGWQPLGTLWTAGSCYDLAFVGETVLAATYREGVVRLDPRAPQPRWQPPDVECGLPLRDPGRFDPVLAVGTSPAGSVVLAGGRAGIRRSGNAADWVPASEDVFTERVTLPPTWLFASGEHSIEVVEDDARR